MAAPGLTGALLWLDRIAPLSAEAAGLPAGVWSPGEQARLGRITSAKRRAEFLAGRLLLRRLLARARGGDPLQWTLSAPDDGPPSSAAAPGLHLGLSHSGDWVAAAASPASVGIDLETPGRPRDVLALADAVCTQAERDRLRALQGPAREEAFRVLWTLKEAWLKRRTEGVAPDRLAALCTRPGGGEAWAWTCPEVALAWVHAQGLPQQRFGPDPFGGAPPVPWGIDDHESAAAGG